MNISNIDKNKYGYLFVAPYFISLILFFIYPIFDSFRVSLTSWDGFGSPRFIAFGNYQRLFQDPLFYKSIQNTFMIWLLSGIPQIILALVIAAIINSKRMLHKHFFKATFFLPNIITSAFIGMLFLFLFDWQGGMVNLFLLKLNIIAEPVYWAGKGKYMVPIASFILLFQWFGYQTIMVDSGMTSISKELYESAEVDGANGLQKFFRITIPLIKPILIFITVSSLLGGFKNFDIPYILSGGEGEPQKSLLTMNLYLINCAFKYNRYGYGAALGFAYCLVIIAFTVITMKLMKSGTRSEER